MRMSVIQSVCLSLIVLCSSASSAAGVKKNGFDLTDGLVPTREIRRGGPPRDGIPAIYLPKFVKASEQRDVAAEDTVLGIVVDGIAKAFPVDILIHHEVVNDWTQSKHLVVTYCPLCGSGMAFHAGTDGQAVFGVSGLLYNSDVLLYDYATESLWSQILGQAVTGPKKGEQLTAIPVIHGPWQNWLARYPDTWVMSRDTGYKSIRYGRMPESYRGYERSRQLFFPVAKKDKRFHPKSWVLGVELDGVYKAYPFAELEQTTGVVTDRLGNQTITIRYADDVAWAEDAAGKVLPAIRLYWFAWFAFHPDTAVFEAP